jgi:sulfur-carrier protein
MAIPAHSVLSWNTLCSTLKTLPAASAGASQGLRGWRDSGCRHLTLDLDLTLTPPPSRPPAAAPLGRARSKKRRAGGVRVRARARVRQLGQTSDSVANSELLSKPTLKLTRNSSNYIIPALTPVGTMINAWSITLQVPEPLRDVAGASKLELSAASVRAVLVELERRHPALHRSICDETGSVRRHINVFVNTNHMRDCSGLETPLAPGDVVTILPAVSGG